MPLAASDFLRLLDQDPRGRVWILALAHGCAVGHCGEGHWSGLFARALEHMRESVSDGHEADPELAWRALHRAQGQQKPRQLPTDAHGVLAAPILACTHVTTTAAMETYQVDGLTSAMAGTFAWHDATDDGTRLKIVGPLLMQMHREGLLKPKPGAMFGLHRMWISTASLSEHPSAAVAESRDLASFQRDYRGLVHLTKAHFLVGYSLDPQRLPKTHRPVVLDGAGVRFRSWCDQRADGDTWGAAVNLGSLALGLPEIDGAPEAIVPSVPFDATAILEVRPLGHPGGGRGGVPERGLKTDVDDDNAYAHRIGREAMQRGIETEPILKRIREELHDR